MGTAGRRESQGLTRRTALIPVCASSGKGVSEHPRTPGRQTLQLLHMPAPPQLPHPLPGRDIDAGTRTQSGLNSKPGTTFLQHDSTRTRILKRHTSSPVTAPLTAHRGAEKLHNPFREGLSSHTPASTAAHHFWNKFQTLENSIFLKLCR